MKDKTSWLDKPWTWRGYIKFTAVSYLIALPILYAYYAYLGIAPTPKDLVGKMKEKDYEKSLHKIE